METNKTYFAPAKRVDKIDIYDSLSRLNDNDAFKAIISQFPDTVLILNKHRQVVYANDVFLKQVNMT